jgi:hypothetical protein
MNPYLAKLRALEKAPPPAEGVQGGFVSFVGARSSPISDFEIPKSPPCENRQNRQNLQQTTFGRINRFCCIFQELERRCPDYVDRASWQAAVEDGRRFLAKWGERAEALGWTARDLFGLHKPPERPHQSYRRLSRYDETGLIWLLNGREVTALTADTAAIRAPSGSITVYRKSNKPALGPLGDSSDDFK